jgi:hypothetical protein
MTAGGLCLLFVASCTVSESDHRHQMNMEAGSSGVAMDVRQVLNLPPAAQEGLKLTMREHLEALQAIVAALAREDYGKASVVAHEDLGFPKHHQAMQREQGAPFPPKYQELAMAHHQVAEDLAQVIPSRDMKKILPHLDRTMKACVACHQAYKL